MNISINGEQRPFEGITTLADLVEALELADRRIAVEVNEALVPRAEHGLYTLEDGDRVEIVHAIGGG
ncbi:MAG: sulfur carrier protein ThiS [Gammaproteobacteria bacterium]|nr:sulfur carrier protein ThiS [Gammaproteobacteria bacterium]